MSAEERRESYILLGSQFKSVRSTFLICQSSMVLLSTQLAEFFAQIHSVCCVLMNDVCDAIGFGRLLHFQNLGGNDVACVGSRFTTADASSRDDDTWCLVYHDRFSISTLPPRVNWMKRHFCWICFGKPMYVNCCVCFGKPMYTIVVLQKIDQCRKSMLNV